jgi:sigma-B regulation protein RsbU (phosphoserine phosphatase)
MRILIADDASDQREILGLLLARWGHEVVPASDGLEAWEILNRERVQLVLSDWMMPGLDGLELCRRIRAREAGYYVYIILLTARDDKEDLIAGMHAGADDFLTKPFHFEELRVRLRSAQRVLELETQLEERNRHLVSVNEELRSALDRIQADLVAAAAMQRSLLPQGSPLSQRLALDWLFIPAAVVAGDIFNFFEHDGRYLEFYLLDVAGHGVPSAMLSVSLSRILSLERAAGGAPLAAPHEVVATLNRRFQSDDASLYFTIVYGHFDTLSGIGELCQAGHPHPLLVRRGGAIERVGEGGFPVGMLPDLDYESVPFTLGPGDRLILYSDGVTDCRDAAGEQFELGRLHRVAGDCHDKPLATLTACLAERLQEWRGTGEIEDDISMLVLERR